MRRPTMLVLSLVCGLLLMACSTTETNTNTNTNTNTSTTSGTTENPAAATSPASGTASTTGDSIGVPECDEFMTKYDACVSSKVPEMVRAQYKEALARARSDMRTRANDPATRSTMATYCKQALEQAKTSMTPFNCAW